MICSVAVCRIVARPGHLEDIDSVLPHAKGEVQCIPVRGAVYPGSSSCVTRNHDFLDIVVKHTENSQEHSSLLYESPGGNQVDGLPPVAHILPHAKGHDQCIPVRGAVSPGSSSHETRKWCEALSSGFRVCDLRDCIIRDEFGETEGCNKRVFFGLDLQCSLKNRKVATCEYYHYGFGTFGGFWDPSGMRRYGSKNLLQRGILYRHERILLRQGRLQARTQENYI